MNIKRQKFYSECKEKLNNIRNEYLSKLSRPTSAQRESSEIIESANFEQQLQASSFIRKKMIETLPEIERALRKFDIGTFGLCEVTGEEIELNRLKAVPWARTKLHSIT